MLDEKNLLKLIKNGETPEVEFKRSEFVKGNKNKELAKAMAALANFKGGLILIGVNDDGTIEGFSSGEKELKEYREKVDRISVDNCEPPIKLEFSQVKLEEGMVFVIQIIKKTGYPARANGKFYIRHGITTRELTEEELKDRFTNSETNEESTGPIINSFDRLFEEQSEVHNITHEGTVIPYIEFEATEHHECVLYSKIYNNFFEKAYYLETSSWDVSIDNLKEILLTYYNTFINYSHYHSPFNISLGGLSWIGYGPNNFVEALQNQDMRLSQIEKKFGNNSKIHHRETACFIDENDVSIFYICATPDVNPRVNELTLDYFDVGFIFKEIPFNQIYNEFFNKIKFIPESLLEVDDGLTETISIKKIPFFEEGVVTTEHRNIKHIPVSGLYGELPKELKKNAILNRHDKIIVNLRDYHEMNQRQNYHIYDIKATEIPCGSFPASILSFDGTW